MASNTILPSEFNGRNVTVATPKVVEIEKDGKRQAVGKKAYINYNGERLNLQSATEMRVPFGLSVYAAEGGGAAKHSINVSFNGYQQAGDVKAFYDTIVALDNAVKDAAVKNSKAWFGKERTREVLEEFYTPSIKFGKDASKDYPPTMKLNLRRSGDGYETKFYDPAGKPIRGIPAEEMLAKGATVTALMECSDVWIAGTGKFNLRWNVTQLIVHKIPDGRSEFAFKLPGVTPSSNSSSSSSSSSRAATALEDEVDDEEEQQELATAAATATRTSSAVAAVLPAASQEDAAEESEEEEAPPPPKKQVKKRNVVVAKA
jgi:hypothetical protein